ncbi:MAG: hypothetical protein IJ193_06315 [Bacilli bacterium]|nr:hypothetical protein [Bacilli bacterium]
MEKLVQIGEIDDGCRGLLPIVRVIRRGLYPIVQILIPIVLIIYGIIDLGKAVIASDEKEIKAAQSRLIKRCIYAALIFFVVTLVTLIMDIVASGGNEADTSSWNNCWNAAK